MVVLVGKKSQSSESRFRNLPDSYDWAQGQTLSIGVSTLLQTSWCVRCSQNGTFLFPFLPRAEISCPSFFPTCRSVWIQMATAGAGT